MGSLTEVWLATGCCVRFGLKASLGMLKILMRNLTCDRKASTRWQRAMNAARKLVSKSSAAAITPSQICLTRKCDHAWNCLSAMTVVMAAYHRRQVMWYRAYHRCLACTTVACGGRLRGKARALYRVLTILPSGCRRRVCQTDFDAEFEMRRRRLLTVQPARNVGSNRYCPARGRQGTMMPQSVRQITSCIHDYTAPQLRWKFETNTFRHKSGWITLFRHYQHLRKLEFWKGFDHSL